MSDPVQWDRQGPLESVTASKGTGWHAYSKSVPFGKGPAREPGGWKYVWQLTLECGHTVQSMSDTYRDRQGTPEPPRVARCPHCREEAEVHGP